MQVEEIKKVYDNIKYYKKVNHVIYQLLGYLGFIKEEILNTNYGDWEIYTKKNFVFPYFNSEFNPPLNKFCAIFKNSKEFLVYGIFDKIDEITKKLTELSSIFAKKEKRFLGIPLILTEENAQDYGYIRGLILGVILMASDFSYSFIFKLKSGIIMGFIEYVKIIYYGTPGFGLFVGITGTGLYFIFLLMFIPILLGWYYKKKATKRIFKMLKNFCKDINSYEFYFGHEAEKIIEDEFTLIIEEKKKAQMYKEISSYVDISKTDFEEIYEKLKTGFLKIKDFITFITEYEEKFKNFPLNKFLKIAEKYENAKIETEIRFQI